MREYLLEREDILERVMRETYTARNVQVTASLHSSSLYIRIRSHRLLRLDDNKVCCKLSTGVIQVDCQEFLSTSLMEVVSTTCCESANIKLHQCGFHRLNET